MMKTIDESKIKNNIKDELKIKQDIHMRCKEQIRILNKITHDDDTIKDN